MADEYGIQVFDKDSKKILSLDNFVFQTIASIKIPKEIIDYSSPGAWPGTQSGNNYTLTFTNDIFAERTVIVTAWPWNMGYDILSWSQNGSTVTITYNKYNLIYAILGFGAREYDTGQNTSTSSIDFYIIIGVF